MGADRGAAMDHEEQTFETALGRMAAAIEGESVTLRELLDGMGEQGLLMICALLSLPFLLPVSVPGLSTAFGLAILLLAAAVVVGGPPRLPRFILDRRIGAVRLAAALERGRAVARRLDGWVRPRLDAVAAGRRAHGAMIGAGGVLLLWPLGLVPFSNTLPGAAVLALSLGLSRRDGAMILAGYGLLAATTIYFGVVIWGVVGAASAIAGAL
jgi:hypothetical protein